MTTPQKYGNLYGNVDLGTLITAVGATTTQVSADQTNYNHRGLAVFVNVTSIGAGSVTPYIQARDNASGLYFNVLSGAPITTNVSGMYRAYPGISVVAGSAVSDILGCMWRIIMIANNANPASYTMGAALLV